MFNETTLNHYVNFLISFEIIANSKNRYLEESFLDKTNTLVGENTDVFGLQVAYLKEIVNTELISKYIPPVCLILFSYIYNHLPSSNT